MVQPAISVESLSKVYKLYPTRRSRMLEMINPFEQKLHKKFHALKDVSFSVKQGEVLGLIGQNGSGKSTILKILSSVVTPTSGSFSCNGRVTALLELGGGFDMELTGIENIFFLGAIQGYKRREMEERLNDILDFAEIGKYANQPVKNYSSGMYVRLAFSMSINIDPDILIIDEALAVGDIRFQQKCFRKIREFKEAGKTIVFCSHSLSAVNDFCTRTIWLHEGVIMEDDKPQIVTEKYQSFMANQDALNKQMVIGKDNKSKELPYPAILKHNRLDCYDWIDVSALSQFGQDDFIVSHVTIVDKESNSSKFIYNGGEKIILGLVVRSKRKISNPGVEIKLHGHFGATVLNISNYLYGKEINIRIDQEELIFVEFNLPELGNGNYSFSFALIEFENGVARFMQKIHDALLFEIANPDIKYKLDTQLVLEEVRFDTFSV